MRNVIRPASLALVVAACGAALAAQTPLRTLSVGLIYDPERRIDFSGAPPADVTWIDASTYLIAQPEGWTKVDAMSGRTSRLFDPAPMEKALASLPGVTQGEAARLAPHGRNGRRMQRVRGAEPRPMTAKDPDRRARDLELNARRDSEG